MILRRVCSWCDEVVEEGSLGAPTSHTICTSCEERVHAELDEEDPGVGTSLSLDST